MGSCRSQCLRGDQENQRELLWQKLEVKEESREGGKVFHAEESRFVKTGEYVRLRQVGGPEGSLGWLELNTG